MTREEAHDLAARYAPIFAQKVSYEWPLADQIAPVDLAGSITRVADNPDALSEWPEDEVIPARIYYSVCETTTHFYLVYAVYHVLDWWKRVEPRDLYNLIRDRLDEHVHDMEGALLIVTKEPEGLVDGLVTVAHNNFYLYTQPQRPTDLGESELANEKSLRIAKFNESVDGNIWLDRATGRVKLYVESRGHGIRGDHRHWGAGDAIWYYSPLEATTEGGTLDRTETTNPLSYELVEVFDEGGLWDHRFDERVVKQNKQGKWGFAYYKNQETRELDGGAANPPWSWNDHNDSSPIGEIATDPARFIERYAQGWGPVSAQYLYNPYQAIT